MTDLFLSLCPPSPVIELCMVSPTKDCLDDVRLRDVCEGVYLLRCWLAQQKDGTGQYSDMIRFHVVLEVLLRFPLLNQTKGVFVLDVDVPVAAYTASFLPRGRNQGSKGL